MKSDSSKGGCQCGSVRYEVTGKPIVVYTCHCTECQKQASSAFGISVWYRRQCFKLLKGVLAYWTTTTDSGNPKLCSFCRNCGSRIYHTTHHQSKILSVKGGSLDGPMNLFPVAHIWTKSAQPWVKSALLDEDEDLCYQTEPASFKSIISHYEQSQQ